MLMGAADTIKWEAAESVLRRERKNALEASRSIERSAVILKPLKHHRTKKSNPSSFLLKMREERVNVDLGASLTWGNM